MRDEALNYYPILIEYEGYKDKIVDDLRIYYKIVLTTEFIGKLFNKMYSWLIFIQDKLNDIVRTPSYVANLLVKLARVDKNPYVWEFVIVFRVIIMIMAGNQVNTRVLKLLPNFKIKKMNRRCAG